MENQMVVKFGRSFTAQVWHDQELITEIKELSYDAAREIARSSVMTNHTGRLMGEDQDYTEVYETDGMRTGTRVEVF